MGDLDGDTLTIEDSGGVGDIIEWTIAGWDENGNLTTADCSVEVVNPGKAKSKGLGK